MDSRKLAFLCLFALAFALFGYAVEYSPENYLSRESHYLYDGETPEQIVEIKHGDSYYYVVTAMAGGSLKGYIALEKFQKRVVEDEVTNRKLFQTAEFARQYSEFKKQVSETPGFIWFISKWGQIPDISTSLSTTRNELVLISSKLSRASDLEIVAQLESVLESIEVGLDLLYNKTSQTQPLEVSFLRDPEVGEEECLKDAVIECFDYLDTLNSLRNQFIQLKRQLEIAISDEPELDEQTKEQLSRTGNLPEEFTEVKNWHTSAQNMTLRESMDASYLGASNDASRYAKEVEARVTRNYAWDVLYAEDTDLSGKTDGAFLSLPDAEAKIKDAENYDYWVDRETLEEFEGELGKARSRFDEGNYDRALEAAEKAKLAAVALYQAGFTEPEPPVNYDLLFTAGVLIIIFLMVIIIIRNRKKLASFVSGGEEEERVEFDGL